MDPIVVQEIIYSKDDFPKPGEVYNFNGELMTVICSKISLKMRKMYFVNIWLGGNK